MPIQINVNGDSAVEVAGMIKDLAGLMSGTIAAPEKPVRNRNTSKAEPTKAEPEIKQSPVDEDPPVEPEAVEPEPEEDEGPVPTVVELRAKAQEAGSKPDGRAKVKALLEKFESKSISDVPEGKRAAFMKELGAI